MLDKNYGEYFGFLQSEVSELLKFYDRSNKTDLIKQWYNGYTFGKAEVYNPWSLIKYMFDLVADEDALPRPFWGNTSSNSVVKDLINEYSDNETKQEKFCSFYI